jgi:acyl-CoA thioester hydrolase
MFHTDVQMRLEDLNTSGHVSNVAFLGLFDEARTRFFGGELRNSDHRGLFDDGAFDVAHVVLGQHVIEYRRELFYRTDPLQVKLWIPRIGRSSFVLNGTLHEPGETAPACLLETAVVFLTRADNVPWVIDDSTRELLAGFPGPRVDLRPRA